MSFSLLSRALATLDGLGRDADRLYFLIAGSVYGAFQSYARALYAELIPPGEEARWYVRYSLLGGSPAACMSHSHFVALLSRYGLFSITDKVRTQQSSRTFSITLTLPRNISLPPSWAHLSSA